MSGKLTRRFDVLCLTRATCWFVTLQAERAGEEKPQQEPQTPVSGQEWPSEFLSDTPVLCQQSGGKPGVTFTSAKGEVFSVLEWAPGEKRGRFSCLFPPLPLPLRLSSCIFEQFFFTDGRLLRPESLCHSLLLTLIGRMKTRSSKSDKSSALSSLSPRNQMSCIVLSELM